MALVVGTALTRFVVAFPVPPPPVPLEQEAPWRIVNLAPDAGVARRMVFDIAFETNNTAWLAVSDGLRCYDGYTWRHFTTADGLPSNFIRTVTVTPDGAVWVGTDHGAGVFGVSGFDARGTTDHLAGPNVRRIVATRDGSLWFCCDRWPDATAKGGLTRLKSGNWETFAMSEGLPSDHVLNLFEESKGRILVLTTGGPAVFTGGRWTPLRDPGFPVGDHTWDICETSDGSLFAQGFDATLIRTGNRWERVRDDSGSTPLCVTRDGAVIRGLGMRGSPRFFGRWTGEGFAPASAVLPEQATDFHVIRQAPDGAVWSVGRGSVIRWEYEAGPWRWWPDLTAPVLQDTEGRMWFASRDEVLFKGDGPPIPVPGMRLPLAADQRRGVWGASAHGVVRWTPAGLDQIPESVCGIDVLRRAIPDPSGCVWFSGRRGDGAEVIACFDGSRWIVLGPEAHGDLSNNSAVADPVHGIWLILAQGSTTDYEVAHATTNGVKRCSIDQGKPRTRLPLLCATRSRLFLLGYNGLWASPLGETLRFDPVQSAGPSVFTGAASQGESAAFVSQEGPDGGASILLWRDGGWLRHAAAYGEGLALNPGGWAMVADGSEFLLWHITTWASPTYISLPTETSIISMARSSEGDYWLGTPQGVFQLVPEQSPPQTLVSGPGSCVEGSPAFAFAKGIAPFTSQSRPARFSFSWRFDDETWTGYEDWPAAGLLLSARQPGRHTLQARARDGLGNEDPSPAVLQFEVRSLPIQDRPWFRPALTFAGLVLTALTVALFVTTRRLRRQALQLEEQVQSRTAELRADIERRERVEEALRQSEQRFQLAMDANRDGLWDWNVASGAVYFSPGYSAILGYAVGELVPHVRSWHELLHPEDKQAALHAASECVENRTPEIEVEFRMRARDGSWRWILSRGKAVERDARGHALRMVGTHTDVTDRRRAEAERERLQVQLTHAQKMESVGRLAGGVAHDFNNMLQAILGNATLALEEQAPGSSLHE
jgi:PAS domain S-box-containing protein